MSCITIVSDSVYVVLVTFCGVLVPYAQITSFWREYLLYFSALTQLILHL